MSRVGKKPIDIPEKVKVEIKGSIVNVSGPLGVLDFGLPQGIAISQKENKLFVEPKDSTVKNSEAIRGTVRARVNNMVLGISKGFSKTLEIKGLGYRANVSGSGKLNLELGFSHPIGFDIPKGVTVEVDAKKNTVTVKGADIVLVGDVASKIRRLRPPEPYKGVGVKYIGEHIARKAGKTASVGAKK